MMHTGKLAASCPSTLGTAFKPRFWLMPAHGRHNIAGAIAPVPRQASDARCSVLQQTFLTSCRAEERPHRLQRGRFTARSDSHHCKMRSTYVGLLEYKRHTCWELSGFQTVREVFFSFTVPKLLKDQQLLVDNSASNLSLSIW